MLTKLHRKNKVELLFKQIAFIAESCANDIKTRDKLLKPLAEELWTITREQVKLNELDHLINGDANEREPGQDEKTLS